MIPFPNHVFVYGTLRRGGSNHFRLAEAEFVAEAAKLSLEVSPMQGVEIERVLNEIYGLPKDLIRRVNATNPDANAWALFERNEIGAAEFDRLFLEESTALGHPIRGADVRINGK